jgi:DNA polymerase/3'-5' exonuclease PolX
MLIQSTRNSDVIFKDYIKTISSLSPFQLDEGKKKRHFIITLKNVRVRMDIRVCTPEHYSYQKLHWTGSSNFNIFCSTMAAARGYTLSEYELRHERTGLKLYNSEKDILEAIGVSWDVFEDCKASSLSVHVLTHIQTVYTHEQPP